MTKSGKCLCALFVFFCFIFPGDFSARATGKKDWLQACWDKQVKPLAGRSFLFSYVEKQHNVYHSPEPWVTWPNLSTGMVWAAPDRLSQMDMMMSGGKPSFTKIRYSKDALLIQSGPDGKISNTSSSDFSQQPFELARYSPVMLINYFIEHRPAPDARSNDMYAVYKLPLGEAFVELWIKKPSAQLIRIEHYANNDLLGDVRTTIHFSMHFFQDSLSFSREVVVEKTHGIKDTVLLTPVSFAEPSDKFLQKPEGYKIEEDAPERPEAITTKASPHRYTITLPHTETQVTLLEFKDFFVIIDVPLSSGNGELVLNEARKIDPAKPVKYYVFGHHHPWYIGGVRPFIRNGTTILCRQDDLDYLSFIATAPHTLKPDSLQLYPTPLKTELIADSKTISDGAFELRIFHMGKKSQHTNDYLLFYIPSEKLLIEDDLTWISQKDSLRKANPRQKALYLTVKELGLDVGQVIQHWPVGDRYGVKSSFPFSELERSATME